MAGAMQSEYQCDEVTLRSLIGWLQSDFLSKCPEWYLKVNIDGTGGLIEIENRDDKKVSMMIDFEKLGMRDSNIIKIVLLWALPNAGPDKYALLKLAKLIENRLMLSGARCAVGLIREIVPKP